MSDMKDVAEHSAEICLAALSFATGAATGIAPFVTSFAVLCAIGVRRQREQGLKCRDRAAARVIEFLEAAPEFGGSDWSRVRALVRDTRANVAINPAALELAARRGARVFRDALLMLIEEAVPFEPGDDLNRRAAVLALGAALDCLLAMPETRAGLDHAMILNLTRDSGLVLSVAARVEGKVDALALQVLALTAKLEETGKRDVARDKGITEKALADPARRIAVDVSDPAAAFREPHRAADIAIRVQAEGLTRSDRSDFVDHILAQVAHLSRDGAHAAALGRIDKALERADAESRARSVRLLDAAIEQAVLARNARAVAMRLVQRNEAEGKSGPQHIRKIYTAWYVRGRDCGLNFDLAVAVELGRLNYRRATTADLRCVAAIDSGNALSTLGKRMSGTTLLVNAMLAYRRALRECPREIEPVRWAAIVLNFASTLAVLGDRQTGLGHLEEALTAVRQALEVLTPSEHGALWVMAQNTLGVVLQSLGDREPGTSRLEEAVAVYRVALRDKPQDNAPLDWAQTQMNLGNALLAIGERERSKVRLREAIASYRAALEEATRIRMPFVWAKIQMNLGNALRALGTLDLGIRRLEEALNAFGEALKERTRENAPFDWAVAQVNLAAIERVYFCKTFDMRRLDRAEIHAMAAKKIFSEAKVAHLADRADKMLASIRALRPPTAGRRTLPAVG